ncbi:Nn.00g039560.m01.CDS01 [Neocucurbitaria sp. VM-36]
MKALILVLLQLGAASAFAHPPLEYSSKNCDEGTSISTYPAPSGPYPTIAPYANAYNATLGYNGTSTTTTTTTKTVTVEPYQPYEQPTTAFPTHVFPDSTSIPTLKPVIPASHDADSLDCLNPLKPGPGTPLHYAQESKPGSYEAGVFAVVVPKFRMPSIVLDYANAASTVKIVRGGDLVIGFSELQAFLRSLTSWQTLKEIVFVTFTPGCGDYEEGERCYFLADKLYFDQVSLTVRAVGKPRDVRDLAEYIDVSWGSYKDQEFEGATPVASSTTGGNAPAPTASGTDSSPSFPTLTPGTNGTTANGTNATNTEFGNSKDGCVAPTDSKYGLPTSCVGPRFDDNLDSKLGYKSSKEFTWDEWVEAMSLQDPYADPFTLQSDSSNSTSLRKRGLLKDGWNAIKSVPRKTAKFAKETTKKAVEKTKNLGNNIAGATKAVVNGAVAAGTFVKNVITGTPNIYENEFSKLVLPPKKDEPECQGKNAKKCELNAKDAKAVKTPWDEDGILLKTFGTPPSESELIQGKKTKTKVKGQFLSIYCVKCGLSGSAKVAGKLTIKGTEVQEGTIDVEMNMEVGLGIGVYAQYLHKETFENNLFNVPVSPFTIGVLTIGPYISIGTRATFMVNATGTALARADLKFAKAKFSYDFKKGTSSQIGFAPQFVPKFEAEGEIELEATFGVPVALKVGLSTLKGCKRCEAAIGIEDYPHIKASAKFALEASRGGENKTLTGENATGIEGGVKTINNCTGIYAALTIGNTVSMVFNGFGFIEQQIDLWKMPEFGIHSWCLGKKTNGTEKKEKRFLIDDHEYNLHNYPRDGLNDTTNSTELVDLTQYVVSTVDEPLWDGPDIPNYSYNLGDDLVDGYWYTTVVYSENGKGDDNYVLVACNDGNIYMQENATTNGLEWYKTCTSLWGGFDDAILSDPNGRFLYYYNNTMSRTGVSRVRAANPQEVPDTAVMVILAPFYYDDANPDASVLAAFDNDDNIFFPVVCTYSSSSSAKIYLVSDIEAGISTLKSPAVKFSITNGDVSECAFLPLTWGADTDATEPEWGFYDVDDYLDEVDAFIAEIEFDETAFNDGDWIDELDDDELEAWFEEFEELMWDDDEYIDEE